MDDPLVEVFHNYYPTDPLRHLYYARMIYNSACDAYRMFEAGRHLGFTPERQAMQDAYDAAGQGNLTLDQVIERGDKDSMEIWEHYTHEAWKNHAHEADAKLLNEIIGIG
jgi:hypothetical protein